jgi:hypothetical protein
MDLSELNAQFGGGPRWLRRIKGGGNGHSKPMGEALQRGTRINTASRTNALRAGMSRRLAG